ncbi:hypothetical protein P692DRAFT_20915394 [Suillus brevipes Sb2]|nr:hypothetical protein P692DRAFT_20915394 [Suillus brevipes Sb2]
MSLQCSPHLPCILPSWGHSRQCTQPYIGAALTDIIVWITVQHLALCGRFRSPFYRRFPNITGSRTWPAGNHVKRCTVFRSAGLGSVSITNILYV